MSKQSQSNKHERKHQHDNSDYDDDDERVDYIYIGTEFPTEQQQRSIDRRQNTWDGKPKGYSRDAFKGGFSAGYHGTVGSKDGWKPSASFVSSRGSRAERREMRPEDFMDEEDLADRHAAQTISVKPQYLNASETQESDSITASDMATEKQSDYKEGGGIVGAMAERVSAEFNALEQSSIKVSSKIGNQIMSLMGWKPGQGIGPLTTVVQQQQHSVGGDGDDQDKQQRLPPRPVALVDCEPPTQNRHGLGYGVDLDALPVNSDNTAEDLGTPALPALGAIFKSKPKTEDSKPKLASKAKKKRQQKTDMLRLSFGSFGEDEDEDNGQGSGIAGGMGRSKTQLERLVDERAKPVPKRTMPQTQLDQMASLCHDGRPPLSGFELVRLAEDSDALYYEGPELPSTYDGMRDQAKSFRWGSAPATGSQLNLKDANNSGGSRFTMAENRTKLSVMTDAPKPPPAHEAVNAATATAALAGFMPFADNLEKQSRYRQYLETCAKFGDKNPSVSATVLSKLSSEKESQEFTRLAQLFRPNTTMLSRFTRATSDLDTAPEETAKVTEDKSVGSAKNKTIVRAVLDWVPSQLLCKRMGIAPPAHSIVNQPKQRNSDSVKCVDEQQQKTRGRRQQASDFIQWRNADFDNPSKATEMVDSGLVSDDITSSLHTDAAIIPEKHPNMALFESIFGDDADS
ncbi:hypothetical protein BX661DRAFT_188502 [Kickxella alabastrina]|uniref:uncharacterized protein n=1 Tax=Kickxella alabastrina TaxID=61397 RepID=UPI00221FDDC0|nr:uncharacterized protein BX661DRAFT_188502 [Kickxella alabastrina]KAI7821279.1 hypothetical protein BX661DRAFT_188502 [Kickxella alabastrina]